MNPITPGQAYQLEPYSVIIQRRGPVMVFSNARADETRSPGVTVLELLEILIDRLSHEDRYEPCVENIATLHGLHAAHGAQIARYERIQKEKGT